MKSMTGFGRAEHETRGVRVTAEVRSWNQRFLEIRLSVPRGWGQWETDLRRLIQRYVSRGHVEAYLRVEHIRAKPIRVVVNLELARHYVTEMRRLASMLKLADSLSVESILRIPEIVQFEEEGDKEQHFKAGYTALEKALRRLEQERRREGKTIELELRRRIAALKRFASRAKRLATRSQTALAEGFKRKIRTLINEAALDEKRLLEEAANIAQRADVSEELSRIFEHLKALSALTESQGPVGKEIDFILQELNRETNTIGSKSQEIALSKLVVQMKSEIEKMREQTQNVE